MMTKYDVQIGKITPDIPTKQALHKENCYLGISLNNPIFWRSSIKTILRWIDNNFASCIIIVGDYIHRHNERIFNNKSPDKSIKSVLRKGDEFLEYFNQLNSFATQRKFIVSRWLDYYNRNEYEIYRDKFSKIFEENRDFRAAINDTASNFISSQIQRGKKIKVSKEEAISLSENYLLEEMAVFCLLINEGYTVEIYPSPELQIFKDIANGKFPELPECIKKRINIELKIK